MKRILDTILGPVTIVEIFLSKKYYRLKSLNGETLVHSQTFEDDEETEQAGERIAFRLRRAKIKYIK
jgi:hypothetical protein